MISFWGRGRGRGRGAHTRGQLTEQIEERTKLTSTRAGKKPLIEYMRRKNKIKEWHNIIINMCVYVINGIMHIRTLRLWASKKKCEEGSRSRSRSRWMNGRFDKERGGRYGLTDGYQDVWLPSSNFLWSVFDDVMHVIVGNSLVLVQLVVQLTYIYFFF